MKILANIPVDYIMGHLRCGHFEGSLEIPDEDIEEFKANPSDYLQRHEELNLLDNLEILADDYGVDDYGELLFEDGVYIIDDNDNRKQREHKKSASEKELEWKQLMGQSPDWDRYPGCGFDRSWV